MIFFKLLIDSSWVLYGNQEKPTPANVGRKGIFREGGKGEFVKTTNWVKNRFRKEKQDLKGARPWCSPRAGSLLQTPRLWGSTPCSHSLTVFNSSWNYEPLSQDLTSWYQPDRAFSGVCVKDAQLCKMGFCLYPILITPK